jgi:hypothetical protein
VNFSIVPLYNGIKAKIYTIQVEGAELSEYKQFVFENMYVRKEAVRVLDTTLKNMAHRRGFIDEFFIRESPQDFNVFKITETDDLRLYCIRYSGIAIIVGSGGIKLPHKYKLKENPHLQSKVDYLIEVEKKIQEKLATKEIRITDNGFEGDLNFKDL